MDKIYLIVLNWNRWKDTIECLQSIYANDYNNYQVIVVDNNSSDNSIEYIKEWSEGKLKEFKLDKPIYYKEFIIRKDDKQLEYIEKNTDKTKGNNESNPLILIQTRENLGYAGGNNIGIKYIMENEPNAYGLVLNNDTIIPKNFISNVIDILLRNSGKNISVMGFPAYKYDNPEEAEVIYVKENILKGPEKVTSIPKKFKGELIKCKSVGGHAMLITPSSPIKLIPEHYFLYYEESDFCNQIINNNGNIYVSLNTPVYHKHSGTVGLDSPIQLYYAGRNLLYYMKLYRNGVLFLLFLILKTSKTILNVMKYLLKRDLLHAKALIRAYVDFFLGRRGKQWI
ncbi:glycosyltransferase family 2 protein [Aeribacillus alveayuensis]|uniref:GT2 family glycosyltransferase n=1 Tax=Aeribacillus alveayuensis TaxID=279215 RepID=A0ABT9VNL0_9BACI|nr:GT2 family glycosyltransferase [Bacillus alveayuensis]